MPLEGSVRLVDPSSQKRLVAGSTVLNTHSSNSDLRTDRASQLPTLQGILTSLALIVRLECQVLWLLATQAITIGIFSLIILLTVQEFVNTFAFAI